MVENLNTDSGLSEILEKKRISERLQITRKEAQKLALLYPEIEEDYRSGLSLSKIAEKYDIEFPRYPNSLKTLVVEIIKVFIPDDEERAAIAHAHQVARGEYLRDNKIGVFSRTGEERSEFEREKAMRIPDEVRQARALKMGRGSTKAKGLKCWDELVDPETDLNEGDFVIWLAHSIKRKVGRAKGNPDYPEIHRLNEEKFLEARGHPRSVDTVRGYIRRRSKELGIKFPIC